MKYFTFRKFIPFKATFFTIGLLFFSYPAVAQIPDQAVVNAVKEVAKPFDNVAGLESLFENIENQRLVLLGESSHGTSEFYSLRAEISKYLILNKGYRFVAVEGDWPAFTRINAYIKHKPNAPESLQEAMSALDRWPLWMWRNEEFKDFVRWLHQHNETLPFDQRVGLYGVDVYAKRAAMSDVEAWISAISPQDARRVSRNFDCLRRFNDISRYLQNVHQFGESCSPDLEDVLKLVRQRGAEVLANSDNSSSNAGGSDENDAEFGGMAEWEYFNAEHNAKLVIAVHDHYLGNLVRGPDSWNARASFFNTTASRLLNFYDSASGDAETPGQTKGIVWAHNTHIGDARATDLGNFGMVNIGQQSRETHGIENVFAIGFSTFSGSVVASTRWEGATEIMPTPEAMSGSWEYLLSNAKESDRFYMIFNDKELADVTRHAIPHRAIGVTFNLAQERTNNYPASVVSERYDAFIFIRNTNALKPLD